MILNAFALLPPGQQDRQRRALNAVLAAVRAQVALGVTPVVEIDLDLASLAPVYRTREALRTTGRETGIREFEQIGENETLPGYTDEAWSSYLEFRGLPARYPKLRWRNTDGTPDKGTSTPFGIFHQAYWTTKWMVEDEATPGLCAFIHKIEDVGGRVVFISGRWLPEHVAPTITSLERSGVRGPALVIGNDRHESLVPRAEAMTDAEFKASRQVEVSEQYGVPVAFFDDRPENRRAVAAQFESDFLSISTEIPGFTSDPANQIANWQISTFETSDFTFGDPPRHTFMQARYQSLTEGAWNGLYEGMGVNGLPYVLRRRVSLLEKRWYDHLREFPKAYVEIKHRMKPEGLSEREFVQMCESTVPREVLQAIEVHLIDAERMADERLAATFPQSASAREEMRLATVVSWLHSRDIECLLRAIGYSISATGLHDIHEDVDTREVKAKISGAQRGTYSDWVFNWSESLPSSGSVNVGCFNPSLLVGMWQWYPRASRQDAMDVHRLSSHHEGDRHERYDPLEAAINNLLHQREGKLGIRKEPTKPWEKLFELAQRPSKALELGKSGLAYGIYQDLCEIARELESTGMITPWSLVNPSL